MIKYNVYGVASGGEFKDLRGERIYIGEDLNCKHINTETALHVSGEGNDLLIGQCSSGFERNADRIREILDTAKAEHATQRTNKKKVGCKRLIKNISCKFPVNAPFPYSVMNFDDNEVYALASGGSIIYEFSVDRLKVLSSDGKIGGTKSVNFFAIPKIFIGLSRSIAEYVSKDIIEAYFASENKEQALQKIISRAEILNSHDRKSAFVAVVETVVRPIYQDADTYSTGRYNNFHGGAHKSLRNIILCSAATVMIILIICIFIGCQYGFI